MSEVLNFSNVSLVHVQENPNVVYELGGGVIPKMADALDYELDEQANPENMGGLIGVTGPNAAMRNDEGLLEATLGDETAAPIAAAWAEKSAILEQQDSGLWIVEEKAPEDAVLVMMMAVPNWIARGIKRAGEAPQKEVVIAAGSRVMDGKSDLANEKVKEFIEQFGRSPKEHEYFDRYFKEELQEVGKTVTVITSKAIKSEGILPDLFKGNPDLLDVNLAAVRVAGNAKTMALQLRLAGTAVRPDFDSQENPQLYAMSDSVKLSDSAENNKKPKEYQSSVTAARLIPVQAKEMLSQTFAIKQ